MHSTITSADTAILTASALMQWAMLLNARQAGEGGTSPHGGGQFFSAWTRLLPGQLRNCL